MEKIKFVQLTYDSGTTTYVKADAIEQLIEERGKTFIFIGDNCSPICVKESTSEILAKLDAVCYNAERRE